MYSIRNIVNHILITFLSYLDFHQGFSGSSDSKESACNAGDIRDMGSIPGWGRSLGGGHDNPLQCSWVSMVAQLVKDPPARWETWVRSLAWEDPPEEGMATHSSILA